MGNGLFGSGHSDEEWLELTERLRQSVQELNSVRASVQRDYVHASDVHLAAAAMPRRHVVAYPGMLVFPILRGGRATFHFLHARASPPPPHASGSTRATAAAAAAATAAAAEYEQGGTTEMNGTESFTLQHSAVAQVSSGTGRNEHVVSQRMVTLHMMQSPNSVEINMLETEFFNAFGDQPGTATTVDWNLAGVTSRPGRFDARAHQLLAGHAQGR